MSNNIQVFCLRKAEAVKPRKAMDVGSVLRGGSDCALHGGRPMPTGAEERSCKASGPLQPVSDSQLPSRMLLPLSPYKADCWQKTIRLAN